MTTTRAKMYVTGLTLLPGENAGIRVEMAAVSRGDRNASWATATPIGNLSMTINNPSAVSWWEDFMRAARKTGRSPEMYLDIAPSEDGWPGDGHAFRLSEVPEGHYLYGKCGECSMGKDDDAVTYDSVTNRLVVSGKAHSNG